MLKTSKVEVKAMAAITKSLVNPIIYYNIRKLFEIYKFFSINVKYS